MRLFDQLMTFLTMARRDITTKNEVIDTLGWGLKDAKLDYRIHIIAQRVI